jgi:cell shape-determining protein MreC
MKKTFLARRNALLSSANISWGVFALAFAALLLLVRLLAPNLFWQAFTPVFHSADALAAQSHAFFSSFGDTAILALRNEQLTDENTALANENQALLERVAGFEMLKGSVSKKASESIIAGVLARPPVSPYDTLVLAAGAKEGVTVGQEAFGPGGVPIGFVSSVLPDFSRVTLFSAPNMMLQGWIGRENILVTLFGSGAGTMRASLARSAGATEGDTVFTSGPGMLPIGRIVRIDSDPSSPAVTLQIQAAFNLFSVAWVELRDAGPAFAKSFSWATSTLP